MSAKTETIVSARKPVPRGIATSGLPLLSYGFRPFFLVATIFAALAMTLWIAALTTGLEIGGSYGALNWHAHEMLFGYTSAALAGFMLTAIPNWTGRLPVSGMPLVALVALWVMGRLAMALPDVAGLPASMAIDAAFLPALALVAGREIVVGKNWKNLKILAALIALSTANVVFHVGALVLGDIALATRLTVSIYVMLVALMGGRIIPSFTRNWLVKAGSTKLPAPFDRVDKISLALLALALFFAGFLMRARIFRLGGLGILALALFSWIAWPDRWPTAIASALAAVAQAYRLSRWQGWRTVDEPILLILHLAYAFISIGLAGVGAAAMGWLTAPSALHLLTVGVIGNMTFAVMSRASLAHTGRVVSASAVTSVAYLGLLISAVVRPFAEIIPDAYHLLLSISGGCWIGAFGLFALEYGPMLCAGKYAKAQTPRT